MGMGMVLWEWEGMGTEIVIPAHLWCTSIGRYFVLELQTSASRHYRFVDLFFFFILIVSLSAFGVILHHGTRDGSATLKIFVHNNCRNIAYCTNNWLIGFSLFGVPVIYLSPTSRVTSPGSTTGNINKRIAQSVRCDSKTLHQLVSNSTTRTNTQTCCTTCCRIVGVCPWVMLYNIWSVRSCSGVWH